MAKKINKNNNNKEKGNEKGKERKKRGRPEKPKCPKCGEPCKTELGLRKHVCVKKKNEINFCEFCETNYEGKNFKRHQERCYKKMFFEVYGVFLNFLFKIIQNYNESIYLNEYIKNEYNIKVLVYNKKIHGRTDEEIEEIKKEFEKNNFLKNNWDLYKEVMDDLKNEEKNKIENIYNDLKKNNNNNEIDENKLKKMERVKNVINIKHLPYISFREVVMQFYKNYYMENNLIKEKLDKKYGEKDFFKLSEIAEISLDWAVKYKHIRQISHEYNSKYNYYIEKLKKFAENRSKNECAYCGKYILYKYKHFLNCNKMKELYEKPNKELFISKFINYYYEEKKEKIKKFQDLCNEFKNENFEYFVKNIKDAIDDYDEFLERKKNKDSRTYFKFKVKNNKKRFYRKDLFLNLVKNIYKRIEIRYIYEIKKIEEKAFIINKLKKQIYNEKLIDQDEIINEFAKEYNLQEKLDNFIKNNIENNNNNEKNENNNNDNKEEDEEIKINEKNEENNDEESENEILAKKTVNEEEEEEDEYQKEYEEIDNNINNQYQKKIDLQRTIMFLKNNLNKTKEKIKKPPVRINYIIKKK